MVRKLYDVEEAAQLLGVTVDQLNEMRDRREVYAVRDGGVWKFKQEEVDRLIAERGGSGTSDPGEFAELDESLDSILLSEVELGQSGPSTSSTVIGTSHSQPSPESDIKISPSSGKLGSSLNLDIPSANDLRDQPASHINLAAPSSGLTDPSDVRLASSSEIMKEGSKASKAGSGLSMKFDDMDALDLDMPNAGESGLSSGISLGSDALKLVGDDDLSLDDAALSLGEETKTSAPGSSGVGSAIQLAGDDDDEIVLGGSGPGSDVTRSASDSGISLLDPTDSGLSLETNELNLGGNAVESLELGEDDMVVLQEDGDPDAATQLKADDDFLLTPLDEGGGDESDSGSQVIALDSDVEFDEAAATMLGSGMPGVMALDDDLGGPGAAGISELGMAPAHGMSSAPTMAAMAPAAPDMVISWANLTFLIFCLLFLTLSGMMMYDLMRNMWSWNGPYQVNSSLMDTVLSWFEK